MAVTRFSFFFRKEPERGHRERGGRKRPSGMRNLDEIYFAGSKGGENPRRIFSECAGGGNRMKEGQQISNGRSVERHRDGRGGVVYRDRICISLTLFSAAVNLATLGALPRRNRSYRRAVVASSRAGASPVSPPTALRDAQLWASEHSRDHRRQSWSPASHPWSEEKDETTGEEIPRVSTCHAKFL